MEKILHGVGTSFGTAKGTVKIIRTAADYASFQKDQILVTHITDPTRVPIMGKSAGIICEIGGLTSHPAIVSREMGIPCVVQAHNAMSILKDGQEIHLNGQTGEIYLNSLDAKTEKTKTPLNQPKESHTTHATSDWINDHNESYVNTIGAMDMGTLQPYDWFQFHPLFDREWCMYIEKIIDEMNKRGLTAKDLTPHPFEPFTQRDFMSFGFLTVKTARSPKEKRMKIMEFYNELAKARYKKDSYSLEGTSIVLLPNEADALAQKIPFNEPKPIITRQLGNIYSASYTLQNGLYLDFYMGYGHEYFGPFPMDDLFGAGTILVIKHFPDMRPTDIWPDFKSPCKSLRMYSIYKNVSFKTDLFTCHGVFTGNTVTGLVKWALEIDGKFVTDEKQIEKLSEQLMELSKNQWEVLVKQDFETQKQTGLLINCYNHKPLTDQLGLDWRPTAEMKKAVAGKQFVGPNYWQIPSDDAKRREYWKKIMDPRNEEFPPGAK